MHIPASSPVEAPRFDNACHAIPSAIPIACPVPLDSCDRLEELFSLQTPPPGLETVRSRGQCRIWQPVLEANPVFNSLRSSFRGSVQLLVERRDHSIKARNMMGGLFGHGRRYKRRGDRRKHCDE
jgi:hypothetical protein